MASSNPSQMFNGRHVGWADLRFPPINLWLMPAWSAAASRPRRRLASRSPEKAIQARLQQLLGGRCGIYSQATYGRETTAPQGGRA